MMKAARGSILATASITNKSENQDAHTVLCGNCSAVFIADGMGTFSHARQAANTVMERFKAFAEQQRTPAANDSIRAMFKDAGQALVDLANGMAATTFEGGGLFGTTAIVVFDTEDEIVVAYVGNGAVWHIRSDFQLFSEPHPFPWNAVNILNPHTVPEFGKEALQRYLSDEDGTGTWEPSIIRLVKDRAQGDIIMACTDGIHSADQVRIGRNDKGLWLRYEERLALFYRRLAGFLKGPEVPASDALRTLLDGYLEEVKGGLDDDATLGVLVTAAALHAR